MRILFMGTPEISVSCLSALVEDGRDIVGVLTREDKPRGRKMILTPSPVKAYATEHGIPVYQPKTLRDDAFAALLSEIRPDLIFVVAYGKILPKNVLTYPKFGCINLHVSLLPKYRGAAPMQRAIMAGEEKTGVTVMYMDEGLDTGDIIDVAEFPIGPEDDFETVHDTSAAIGAKLLLKVAKQLENGDVLPRKKQDDRLATYAEKIEKEDCHIDFTKPARVLDPYIRGITPIPMAFAYKDDAMLKIVKARPVDKKGKPGEVVSLDDKGEGAIYVACGEGALKITCVIPEGKGKMSAGDFIRGRKIALGDVLS